MSRLLAGSVASKKAQNYHTRDLIGSCDTRRMVLGWRDSLYIKGGSYELESEPTVSIYGKRGKKLCGLDELRQIDCQVLLEFISFQNTQWPFLTALTGFQLAASNGVLLRPLLFRFAISTGLLFN